MKHFVLLSALVFVSTTASAHYVEHGYDNSQGSLSYDHTHPRVNINNGISSHAHGDSYIDGHGHNNASYNYRKPKVAYRTAPESYTYYSREYPTYQTRTLEGYNYFPSSYYPQQYRKPITVTSTGSRGRTKFYRAPSEYDPEELINAVYTPKSYNQYNYDYQSLYNNNQTYDYENNSPYDVRRVYGYNVFGY